MGYCKLLLAAVVLLQVALVVPHGDITVDGIRQLICKYQELPSGFYGTWTRYPHDPSRPLTITFEKALDQPGFTKYILARGPSFSRTYYMKLDGQFRDSRRYFMLDQNEILLEKIIAGGYYDERQTIEPNGLLSIVGANEVELINITMSRV